MFIVGTQNRETAERIANILNCPCDEYIPGNEKFVVNYGRTDVQANLNTKIYLNKLKAHKIMSKKVRMPLIFETNKLTDIPMTSILQPLFGRRKYHSRGEDIIQPNWKKDIMKKFDVDYFIQYIPKRAEFRVHILGNKIVSVSKKVKRGKWIDNKICNINNGWKHKEYYGILRWILGAIGRRAKNALGYDFGAVDIIVSKGFKIYVLEVNSAPRLNLKRRKLYANYFKNEEKASEIE